MRVDKLQPHKTYKMLSIFGGTGEGIYTVDAPIKTTEVINKLHEVNFTVDGVKDKAMVSEYVEFVEVVLRAKIEQPEGIKYMIQDSFYTKAQAQEYIDMLIEKSEDYIEKKNILRSANDCRFVRRAIN